MPSEPIWERALSRYADMLYRLALLREPSPRRAATAVERAFTTLDWNGLELDGTLEGRLVAQLPPPRRLFRPTLPPLPATFWRLPAAARLGLGLRLVRGYSTSAIATALNRPTDDVRILLLRAICSLAVEDCDALPEACHATHSARLDEPAAHRQHVLGCSRCQDLAPRLERAEQALAEAMARSTAGAALPSSTLHAIRARLGRGADGPARRFWRRPALLQVVLVVAVLLSVAVMVAPRGRAVSTGQASSSARAMVEQALARYGMPPEGDKILHRRYRFDLGEKDGVLLGEMWVDLAQPARHRMQLMEGEDVREVQVGDGERRLRYFSSFPPHCERDWAEVPLPRGLHDWTVDAAQQNRMRHARWQYEWTIDAAAQAGMRDARWQFGAWAAGRHFLQQAGAADEVRSLGSATNDQGSVLTLAAEGQAISGTLLLKLDTETGELREVREMSDEGGLTRSHTSWQLLDEEQMAPEEAKRRGIFFDVQDRVTKRQLPILDPACLRFGVEQALGIEPVVSPARALDLALNRVGAVAFGTVPAGTSRAFMVEGPRGGWTVVYYGDRWRVALTSAYADSFRRDPQAIPAGDWNVVVEQTSPGRLEGQAFQRAGGQRPQDVFFVAEGVRRDELLRLLGTVAEFRPEDLRSQQQIFFDPDHP